jgi:hypothetical protein
MHKLSLQPNTPDKKIKKRKKRRNGVGLAVAEKRKKKWAKWPWATFSHGWPDSRPPSPSHPIRRHNHLLQRLGDKILKG